MARSIADPGRTVQSGYFGAMRLRRHAAVVVAILLAPLIWNTGPAAQAPASQVPRVVDAGENFDARRFQRVLYKELGRPRAGTIPPATLIQ